MNSTKLWLSATSLVLVLSTFWISSVWAASDEAKEGSWISKAPLPDGVSLVKAVVVFEKIYAITGESIFEYDPDADNWTLKTKVPSPRNSGTFGVTVCQNKIYVIGGEYNSSCLAHNEAYDPVTDSWETKKQMPTKRRYVEANTVDGKIYVISGDAFYGARTNVTEVYDPETNTWMIKKSIPYPVIKGASAVIDSKIYILGGLYESGPLNARYNQIYDTETDTWSVGAPLPTPMWYTAACATTGVKAPKRIYIMGGGVDKLLDNVNIYDPESNSWNSGTPLPTNRTGHTIAVLDDTLYVIGGADGWHGQVLVPGSGWNLTSRVDQYIPIGYIPEFSSGELTLLVIGAVTVAITTGKRRLARKLDIKMCS